MARNHRRQSGLCHLSGGSRALSRNSSRTIQACSGVHRARLRSLLRRRGRVSLVAMSIFEEMAGVELRSCPWFRRDFGGRLQIHRAASRSRINLYSIPLGQRCAAADLFLGAALVSPHAWPRLSHRIRFALDPSRWACWQQRNVAGKSVSAGSSPATRARRLFSFADTLLVRLDQRVSTFPLRWGRYSFVASDFRRRARAFTRRAFCLSLTIAGQVFLNFQWDVLLLETGFL